MTILCEICRQKQNLLTRRRRRVVQPAALAGVLDSAGSYQEPVLLVLAQVEQVQRSSTVRFVLGALRHLRVGDGVGGVGFTQKNSSEVLYTIELATVGHSRKYNRFFILSTTCV